MFRRVRLAGGFVIQPLPKPILLGLNHLLLSSPAEDQQDDDSKRVFSEQLQTVGPGLTRAQPEAVKALLNSLRRVLGQRETLARLSGGVIASLLLVLEASARPEWKLDEDLERFYADELVQGSAKRYSPMEIAAAASKKPSKAIKKPERRPELARPPPAIARSVSSPSDNSGGYGGHGGYAREEQGRRRGGRGGQQRGYDQRYQQDHQRYQQPPDGPCHPQPRQPAQSGFQAMPDVGRPPGGYPGQPPAARPATSGGRNQPEMGSWGGEQQPADSGQGSWGSTSGWTQRAGPAWGGRKEEAAADSEPTGWGQPRSSFSVGTWGEPANANHQSQSSSSSQSQWGS